MTNAISRLLGLLLLGAATFQLGYSLGKESAKPKSITNVLKCPVDARDFGDGPNAAELAAKYNAACDPSIKQEEVK